MKAYHRLNHRWIIFFNIENKIIQKIINRNIWKKLPIFVLVFHDIIGCTCVVSSVCVCSVLAALCDCHHCDKSCPVMLSVCWFVFSKKFFKVTGLLLK